MSVLRFPTTTTPLAPNLSARLFTRSPLDCSKTPRTFASKLQLLVLLDPEAAGRVENLVDRLLKHVEIPTADEGDYGDADGVADLRSS